MNLAWRLLLGDIPLRPAPAIATGALYAAGVFGGFAFLQSPLSWTAPVVAALAVTGLFVVAGRGSAGRAWRIARAASRAVLLLVHGCLAYETACLLSVLGWTWPGWVVAPWAALVVAWVATSRSAWRGPRVPLVLVLGLASATSLWGWVREESHVRCDDYLAAVSDPAVRIVVPTRPDLASCAPGDVRPIGRYPRKVADAGDRAVFTTQAGAGSDPSADTMPGAVCEARLPGGVPSCAFEGKAHAIREGPDGRILVAFMRYGEGSGRPGALVALPSGGGLEPAQLVEVDQSGELFVDLRLDRVGLFGDRQDRFTLVEVSSFTVISEEVGRWNPGETRYDPARHEGVLCGSAPPRTLLRESGFLARAFRLAPREGHPLGEGAWAKFALSWGCDVDFERRRVFASVANLGLVVEMDLDTGRVTRSRFLGIGLRSVLLDASRDRLYVADFLRGTVHELDAGTLAVLRTWFAGRYVRDVVFARDGRGLLVTSNLGVARILTRP